MCFSIDQWMKMYIEAVKKQFQDRIWFIGLQGSYGRGEANEHSDIDAVLILDAVSSKDLEVYSRVLDGLPNREKICGFVSGKEELLAWEPSDLFQFYYDTTALFGSLEPLLNCIHEQDILRGIHMGVCNVYHMCAHNLVHEKSPDILKELYKSAAFTLQAIAFLQTGHYEKRKSALLSRLQPADARILKISAELRRKEKITKEELAEYSALLLGWASEWIRNCKQGQAE